MWIFSFPFNSSTRVSSLGQSTTPYSNHFQSPFGTNYPKTVNNNDNRNLKILVENRRETKGRTVSAAPAKRSVVRRTTSSTSNSLCSSRLEQKSLTGSPRAIRSITRSMLVWMYFRAAKREHTKRDKSNRNFSGLTKSYQSKRPISQSINQSIIQSINQSHVGQTINQTIKWRREMHFLTNCHRGVHRTEKLLPHRESEESGQLRRHHCQRHCGAEDLLDRVDKLLNICRPLVTEAAHALVKKHSADAWKT